jgi:hypothetical protein
MIIPIGEYINYQLLVNRTQFGYGHPRVEHVHGASFQRAQKRRMSRLRRIVWWTVAVRIRWSVSHRKKCCYISFLGLDVPNTVVARVQGFDGNVNVTDLSMTIAGFGVNFVNGMQRPNCQFDYAFAEIQCSDELENGVIEVRSDGIIVLISEYFQLYSNSQNFAQSLPFSCVTQRKLLFCSLKST